MRKSDIFKVMFLGVCVSFASCTKNFQDYNTNQSDVTTGQLENDGYAASATLLAMQGWVVPVSTNSNQFMEALVGLNLGGYMADSETGFTEKCYMTLLPNEGWNRVPFNHIGQVYPSYMELKKKTTNPVLLGVSDILRIAFMQRITDCYGPIPYSKIGVDGAITSAYDSQESIYKSMLSELTEIVNVLTPSVDDTFNPMADRVFNGSVEKWIKFANTLKLRLAMRIVYTEPVLAQEMAEEAVKHSVGVMSSNEDNALYSIVGDSPLYIQAYSYGDIRMSADIACYMLGYNDARIGEYFAKSTFTSSDVISGLAVELSDYHGLRRGIDISTKAMKYANLHPENLNKGNIWMLAAESAFLKAEGALRSWDMGISAKNAYEEGVRLSFAQWNASGVDAYLADNSSTPEAYIDPTTSGGIYDEAAPSTVTVMWDDAAEFETKLERLITQKWIANFPLGHEAWSDYRRTGYPNLFITENDRSQGVVNPSGGLRRLIFTDHEYRDNADNVNAAVSLLNGADNAGTRLWWDANPRINL